MHAPSAIKSLVKGPVWLLFSMRPAMQVLSLLSVCLLLLLSSADADPASGSLAGAVNSFSLSLFNQLSREKGQVNVFVSPFSVSTALSMLLLGARGPTADNLRKGLHFDAVDESNGPTVHQLFQKVLIANLPTNLEALI